MNQPDAPKPEKDSKLETAPEEPSGEQPPKKLRYEKPVLRRLGSVNKLTLSVSGGVATDGSKTVKMTG